MKVVMLAPSGESNELQDSIVVKLMALQLMVLYSFSTLSVNRFLHKGMASLVAQLVKNLPAVQETWV